MLGNLNTTVNGTQLTPSSCFTPGNTSAERITKTFVYCLILVVSLTGNISIGIIVYKTKTMRRAINFLIVNMAMSDLMFPLFVIPWSLTLLNANSWPIGGPLGKIMCKLIYFLPNVSIAVSVQSLVLIAVDRFGAVIFPLRYPLIGSKLYPYFILATWIAAIILISPNLIAFKLIEYPGKLALEIIVKGLGAFLSCSKKVSADQYHMNISRAQVYSSSRSSVFKVGP
ncbi:endothelin receptor type B-like [Oculina patagonica]